MCSQLRYCNTLLTGLPIFSLTSSNLPSVARANILKRKSDYIIPLLKAVQWPPCVSQDKGLASKNRAWAVVHTAPPVRQPWAGHLSSAGSAAGKLFPATEVRRRQLLWCDRTCLCGSALQARPAERLAGASSPSDLLRSVKQAVRALPNPHPKRTENFCSKRHKKYGLDRLIIHGAKKAAHQPWLAEEGTANGISWNAEREETGHRPEGHETLRALPCSGRSPPGTQWAAPPTGWLAGLQPSPPGAPRRAPDSLDPAERPPRGGHAAPLWPSGPRGSWPDATSIAGAAQGSAVTGLQAEVNQSAKTCPKVLFPRMKTSPLILPDRAL
ncbi:uncharacterized protein LOC123827453 [Phyllostomus hastatus]|uniref:uncharacterized protein LOC123827453 n=1 Tax=Phyllostomus hastatus TaxID=9423 RepID=UPI001E681A31|nr:uncharacterized protein LOC123827453 [Phyllostomus hastatus]